MTKQMSNLLWREREPQKNKQSMCQQYAKVHRKTPATVSYSGSHYRREVLGLSSFVSPETIQVLWEEYKQVCFDLMYEQKKRQRDVRAEAREIVVSKFKEIQ